MKFHDLVQAAINRSEIPLRFEPGAEESLEQPLVELLRAWIEAHTPARLHSDFEYGQKALIEQLLGELSGERELPA